MTAEEFKEKYAKEHQYLSYDEMYEDSRNHKALENDVIQKFAEQYHEAKTKAEDKELLCSFFKYFRDNGEDKIGMSIEEFVNEFLNAHEL